jgi:hypothetical protein
MHRRTWVIFIAVNIIVSAAVMLTILFAWEHIRDSAAPAPTPTLPLLATQHARAAPTISPVSSPAAAEPVEYTVQEGDTLSAIAQSYDISLSDLMAANGITDPNLLHIGQVLIIPSELPASPATQPATETSPEPAAAELLPTPLPTLTASGPPLVEIGQVVGSGDLATEVVVVRNLGGTVSLEGWTLHDAEGNTFTFPSITLFSDVQMRVHSTPGRSTPSDLYWGRETPAWNEGELITLRNEAGNVVDTYIVP